MSLALHIKHRIDYLASFSFNILKWFSCVGLAHPSFCIPLLYIMNNCIYIMASSKELKHFRFLWGNMCNQF